MMKQKWISILLAAALLLTSACSTSGTVSGQTSVIAAGEGQVVDGAGVVKDIPEDPEHATIASVYAVSVPLIVALNLSDRVLAINVKSKFWTQADEDLAKAGTVGRGVVDLEALASYAPTVLIHRSNDPETVEAVGKIGVDVLCITVENVADIKSTLAMMGQYFGVEERASEVIAWIDGKFAMIEEITSRIPDSERVTALLMGGEPGRVAGSDMLQSWMIEQAGGICVVDEGADHNWVNVGVEKIFDWNPQYIFCTSSTGLDYTPESLMEDPAWSAVEAVQTGKVIAVPAKLDSWDMPGLSCVLGTMYMLYQMYPSYFTAEQLEAEIDEYYQFMFDKTFDAGYLGYDLNL